MVRLSKSVASGGAAVPAAVPASVLAAAVLGFSLSVVTLPAAAAEVLDSTPRTALISAFPPEWQALQTGLEDRAEHRVHGVTFVTGSMGGQPVVLFLSGVSMVNAAMTTQMALDRFDIERIVFSGIAGGADPELNVGDVVVPAQWGKYLEGVLARETDGSFAIPPWMTSEFPGFGIIFTLSFGVASSRSDEVEPRFWYPVDEGLLAIAQEVANSFDLPACNAENACLSEAPVISVGGNGVSGSFFVDNAAFREHAFDTFEARVLDMESAAVANEMTTFMSLAAGNSAEVMRAFVAALD